VHQAGGQFIGDDWHHSPMDSPEAIEGLQFFYDLVNIHKVSPEPKNILPYTFVNQHSAMEWGGHTENWVGMRKNAKFRWDVALLPQHPSNNRGSERVAVGVGINKNSPHRALAWKFIKHISSYQSHRKLCAAGSSTAMSSTAPTRTAPKTPALLAAGQGPRQRHRRDGCPPLCSRRRGLARRRPGDGRPPSTVGSAATAATIAKHARTPPRLPAI
jgi:ABC-type glycerol-3-phosphate transport system substrate-binding protein